MHHTRFPRPPSLFDKVKACMISVHWVLWKTKSMSGVCFSACAQTCRFVYPVCKHGGGWMHGLMHQCMQYTHGWGVCLCEASVSLCDVCVRRAIWSPLPCRGPCEVLSAWPLWSSVATRGLLHSTSSPVGRPQKRKFGSLKWRGCSRAIYRALYRSSATHDIPYEKQCVCGACGVLCVWVLGMEGVGRWMGLVG